MAGHALNIDEIMKNIREEVRQQRDWDTIFSGMIKPLGEDWPAMDSNAIDEAIASAEMFHGVGMSLPPMTRQRGMQRKLAMLFARLFLRVAQIITRDQRAFNQSSLTAIRTIRVNLNTLEQRLAAVWDEQIRSVRALAAVRGVQTLSVQALAAVREEQTRSEQALAAVREKQTRSEQALAAVREEQTKSEQTLAAAREEQTKSEQALETVREEQIKRVLALEQGLVALRDEMSGLGNTFEQELKAVRADLVIRAEALEQGLAAQRLGPCALDEATSGRAQALQYSRAITEYMQPPYALALERLGELFPLPRKLPPLNPSTKTLDQWSIEEDDAPIFKFLYQAHQPWRHLEFGTWQGWGTSLCMESCTATVWTINLPDGESKPDGSWAYGERVTDPSNIPKGVVTANFGEDELGPITFHRTDAGDYIGRIYREKGLGKRVCQIYCDSRDWDTSNYPADFFDSVLIDGGHQPEVVINDTRKSLQVLRPGGLIMWHDFCPFPEIRSQFESVKGVTAGVETMLPELQSQLKRLCWINPSWILVGIKK